MRLLSIIFLANILLPAVALAKKPSYDSISFSYVVANSGYDMTGYSVSVMRSFNDSFFGEFGFASSTVETQHFNSWWSSDDEFEQLAGVAAIGFRQPLSRSTDFYTQLGYAQINITQDYYDESVNSYSGEIGMRSMVTRNAELSAAIVATKSEDVDTDTTLQVGFDYYIFKRFSVGLQYINNSDHYIYGFSIRLDN